MKKVLYKIGFFQLLILLRIQKRKTVTLKWHRLPKSSVSKYTISILDKMEGHPDFPVPPMFMPERLTDSELLSYCEMLAHKLHDHPSYHPPAASLVELQMAVHEFNVAFQSYQTDKTRQNYIVLKGLSEKMRYFVRMFNDYLRGE